jgi:hypothetical protein
MSEEGCLFCEEHRKNIFNDRVIEVPPYRDNDSDYETGSFIHRECLYHAVWNAHKLKELKKLLRD